MSSTENGKQVVSRAAYSPAEFARAFDKHQSWTYRLLYAGKIRGITDFGRIRIPATELDRILESARPYDPQPSNGEKEELAAAAR